MRFALLSFSLLAMSSLLSADVISGSVSCGSPSGDYYNLTTVSQTSSRCCNVLTNIINVPFRQPLFRGSRESSTANVMGRYSLSSNGVSGELVGNTDAYPHSTASATITFTDTFTTSGPVRAGVVEGDFYPNLFRYGGSASANIVSPVLPYATFTEAAPTMTFELGEAFTLTIVARATALSDDGTSSFSSFDVPFNLNFFEADGVTPVALTELHQSEVSKRRSLRPGLH